MAYRSSMAGNANVTYSVITRSGYSTALTLENLERRLATELEKGFAFSPIRRIVKVTREDIELPGFVKEYNAWCDKHRK